MGQKETKSLREVQSWSHRDQTGNQLEVQKIKKSPAAKINNVNVSSSDNLINCLY